MREKDEQDDVSDLSFDLNDMLIYKKVETNQSNVSKDKAIQDYRYSKLIIP